MSGVVVQLEPAAVTRDVAAEALGMGVTLFAERVQPHLAVLRVGAKTLIPVAELRRFADEHAEHVFKEKT